PPASWEAQFYGGIEDLIVETAGQDSDQREGALGEFLARFFDATAAMAISNRKDDRITCLGQWGQFEKASQVTILELGVFLRNRLHSTSGTWVRLEPGSVALPGGHPTARFDAILVP